MHIHSLSRRVKLTFTKTHYTTETRRDKIIPTAHLHGKLIRLHTKVPLFLPCLCCFLEQQNSKSFRNFESHVGERRKDSKYLTKILQKLILLFQLSRVLHSSSLASSSFNTNPFSVRKRIEKQKNHQFRVEELPPWDLTCFCARHVCSLFQYYE